MLGIEAQGLENLSREPPAGENRSHGSHWTLPARVALVSMARATECGNAGNGQVLLRNVCGKADS